MAFRPKGPISTRRASGHDAGGTRANVRLPPGLDVDAWRRRHAAGEVPDATPFGLHRMARYGVQVDVAPPLPGRLAGRLADAVSWRLDGLELVETAADVLRRQSRLADVVLCYDERSGVPAALVSGRAGPPVVTGIAWLTDLQPVPPRLAALARRALPRAALVWSQCGPMLELLHRDWALPRSRLRHLTLGVDADFYRPASAPPTPGLVVSAGDDRFRDHELLIAALGEVHRRNPETQLDLATTLPVDMAPDLGTVHRARLGGRMRDLYGRASAVAIALHPTATGSGLTVALEGMSSGLPVVITNNPGVEDYVEHGQTGLLVPPGDRGAFVDAVTALLDDPERAAAMGAAGRHAVLERYTTEVMARQLAGMVHEVV